DGLRTQDARRLSLPPVVRPCLPAETHHRAGADSRADIAFSGKALVSDDDRGPGNAQAPREFPAGGQLVTRTENAIDDGLPQLAINLTGQVLAANQAYMDFHSPCLMPAIGKLAELILAELALQAVLCAP